KAAGFLRATLETDAKGRFRVAVPPDLAGAQTLAGVFDESVGYTATGRRARIAPLVLRAGEQDLGNLQLVALPFLVSVAAPRARPSRAPLGGFACRCGGRDGSSPCARRRASRRSYARRRPATVSTSATPTMASSCWSAAA